MDAFAIDETEAEIEIVLCFGGARPEDTHLASTIHCMDEDIIPWLKKREKRKRSIAVQSVAIQSTTTSANNG